MKFIKSVLALTLLPIPLIGGLFGFKSANENGIDPALMPAMIQVGSDARNSAVSIPQTTKSRYNEQEKIALANLYNYALEPLSRIELHPDALTAEIEREAIFNNIKIADISDPTVRRMYMELVKDSAVLQMKAEAKSFRESIQSDIVKASRLEVMGDMVAVFSAHQDPLGLSAGFVGPAPHFSWNPGAMLGQGYASYLLYQTRRDKIDGEKIKAEIDRASKSFEFDEAIKQSIIGLKARLFESRSAYANDNAINDAYFFSSGEFENLLRARECGDLPSRLNRLLLMQQRFSQYPPYSYYLAEAYASIALSGEVVNGVTTEQARKSAIQYAEAYIKHHPDVLRNDNNLISAHLIRVMLGSNEDARSSINSIIGLLPGCESEGFYWAIINASLKRNLIQEAAAITGRFRDYANVVRAESRASVMATYQDAKTLSDAYSIRSQMSKEERDRVGNITTYGGLHALFVYLRARKEVPLFLGITGNFLGRYIENTETPKVTSGKKIILHQLQVKRGFLTWGKEYTLSFAFPECFLPPGSGATELWGGSPNTEQRCLNYDRTEVGTDERSVFYSFTKLSWMEGVFNYNEPTVLSFRLNLVDQSGNLKVGENQWLIINFEFNPKTDPFTYKIQSLELGNEKFVFTKPVSYQALVMKDGEKYHWTNISMRAAVAPSLLLLPQAEAPVCIPAAK